MDGARRALVGRMQAPPAAQRAATAWAAFALASCLPSLLLPWVQSLLKNAPQLASLPASLPMSLSGRSKAWQGHLPALLLSLLLLLRGNVPSRAALSAAAPAAGPAAPTDGSAAAAPAAPSGVTPLAPFSSILSCLPFSLLIQPTQSGGPAYSLRLDTAGTSDANFTAAFDYAVTGDMLHLSLSPNVTTSSCASVTVGLPADALREARAAGAVLSTDASGATVPAWAVQPISL